MASAQLLGFMGRLFHGMGATDRDAKVLVGLKMDDTGL